jgi:DHA2 family multidrug resistance protein-like MFS transporter
MLTPRLTRRMRPAYVMAGGFTIAAAGFALLAIAGAAQALGAVAVAYVVLSVGLAPVFTLATDLIVGTVPPERAGTASGISETSSEFGGALGIAVLGSAITTVYRGRMSTAVPGEVPADAAGAAQDTLGGALAVARELPGQLGDDVLAAARDAFVQAFQLTAAICAVLALAAAMICIVLLRNERAGPAEPTGPHEGGAATPQPLRFVQER